jgi:hypothetical protein
MRRSTALAAADSGFNPFDVSAEELASLSPRQRYVFEASYGVGCFFGRGQRDAEFVAIAAGYAGVELSEAEVNQHAKTAVMKLAGLRMDANARRAWAQLRASYVLQRRQGGLTVNVSRNCRPHGRTRRRATVRRACRTGSASRGDPHPEPEPPLDSRRTRLGVGAS